MHPHGSGSRTVARPIRRALAALVALAAPAVLTVVTPAAAADPEELYVVALRGPGVSGAGDADAAELLTQQQAVLASVDAPTPVYSWRTALNGFAAMLRPDQAERLSDHPDVALVERDRVRRLASVGAARAAASVVGTTGPGRGGEGTVIGVVDTGIDPDTPLFADTGGLGRAPRDFTGTCAQSDESDWDSGACSRKLVGATWFVEGFGRDRLRAESSLSPRDTHGHGTQVASIAAGNSEVEVKVGGQRLGAFGGAAPQARIAAYKACWSAPDPADDGCSTADLVSAIDRATGDHVDVLSLAAGGSSEFDAVELALLGAAEAGIVAVAPAGNQGHDVYAGHAAPWVTTVGATTSPARRGQVLTASGPAFRGAMTSGDAVGPARLVPATEVAAAGSSRAAARVCAPHSLDAAEARDAIVICERGSVGRVDKSDTVRLADGVGMVLVNHARGPVTEDLHSLPTVHLDLADGRRLQRWARGHRGARVTLRPSGIVRSRPTHAAWSQHGDPAGVVLKPDLVAPGSGVLAGAGDDGWGYVDGTSAAAADVTGVAARLVAARRDLSATEIRSVLATATRPVAAGEVLEVGSGLVDAKKTLGSPLVHSLDPAGYRAWLEGDRSSLNVPSLMLADGQTTDERTITNVGRRPLYFSLHARGFDGPVTITPAAVWLRPGQSRQYRVVAETPSGRSVDDGYLVIRSARDHVVRVPIAVTR